MPAVLLAILAFLVPTSVLADFTGTVKKVVDGDTFWMCFEDEKCAKIRLCGIDAPDAGEKNYSRSKHALTVVLNTGPVHCRTIGSGTPCDGRSKPLNSGRIVAQCFVYTMDVAAYLVSRGMACDWEKFSGGLYGRLPNEYCSEQ